jgi:REP element-mobilizing transposase RayT
MARRPRVHSPGLLYHVIVRGNHRRKTFLDDRDYRAYLDRLAHYRKRFAARIYAYCLMPNHVHLLVEVSDEPLSKLMQGLQQSYTQYFNRRHRKTGHLFQGRYHAIVCDKDEYLLSLVRYIHLNPVRAKLLRRPERFPYSGHREYCHAEGAKIVDPALVLKLLGGAKRYQRFVMDGIGEGHKDEYYEVEDQRFLGPEGFGEKVVEEGKARPPRRRPLVDSAARVAKKLSLDPKLLKAADRSWKVSRARAIAAYILIGRLGYRLTDVSAALGRDAATVSSLVSRLVHRMSADARLSREVERLGKIV